MSLVLCGALFCDSVSVKMDFFTALLTKDIQGHFR